MKSVIQLLSSYNGLRSDAMTVEKTSFAKFLSEQKMSDDEKDRQYVMCIIENLDNGNGVVSREPFMTVRQFIHVYGGSNDGEVLSSAVGDDGAAAL